MKPPIITCKILHESSVARFPLICLHELTPITDAYPWNAHDHLEETIRRLKAIFPKFQNDMKNSIICFGIDVSSFRTVVQEL